jgi:hypothetical protein
MDGDGATGEGRRGGCAGGARACACGCACALAVWVAPRGVVVRPVDDEDAVAEGDAEEERRHQGVDAVGEAGEGVDAEDEELGRVQGGGRLALHALEGGQVERWRVDWQIAWPLISAAAVCVRTVIREVLRSNFFSVSIPAPFMKYPENNSVSTRSRSFRTPRAFSLAPCTSPSIHFIGSLRRCGKASQNKGIKPCLIKTVTFT